MSILQWRVRWHTGFLYAAGVLCTCGVFYQMIWRTAEASGIFPRYPVEECIEEVLVQADPTLCKEELWDVKYLWQGDALDGPYRRVFSTMLTRDMTKIIVRRVIAYRDGRVGQRFFGVLVSIGSNDSLSCREAPAIVEGEFPFNQ